MSLPVMKTPQWLAFLRKAISTRNETDASKVVSLLKSMSLVHVDAGTGENTLQIGSLFGEVTACETSMLNRMKLSWRLRRISSYFDSSKISYRIMGEKDPRPSVLQKASSISFSGKYSPHGEAFDVALRVLPRALTATSLQNTCHILKRLSQLTAIKRGIVLLALPRGDGDDSIKFGNKTKQFVKSVLEPAGFIQLGVPYLSSDINKVIEIDNSDLVSSSVDTVNSTYNILALSPPMRFEIPPPGHCMSLSATSMDQHGPLFMDVSIVDFGKEIQNDGKIQIRYRENKWNTLDSCANDNLSVQREAENALAASQKFMRAYLSNVKSLQENNFCITLSGNTAVENGSSCAMALSFVSKALGRGLRPDVGILGSISSDVDIIPADAGLVEQCLLATVYSNTQCLILPKANEKDVNNTLERMRKRSIGKSISHQDYETVKACIEFLDKLEIRYCEDFNSMFEVAFCEDTYFDIF